MIDGNMRLKILCLCILLIISGTASAKQLYVKKVVQDTDITTDDSITISLEFENPFGRSIPVVVQDSNILGSNGFEIQCYDYTLLGNQNTTVTYNRKIQAFSAGDFTLDPATVTYTNPDTGDRESIKSEPLKISIKQGASSGLLQGITSIYNCDGVIKRSTSYSTSSSVLIIDGQINRQQQGSSPGDIQQSDQDMQNLKDEMDRKQQDDQGMQDEPGNRIENNSEFFRMKEEPRSWPYWMLIFLVIPLLGIYLYKRYLSSNELLPVQLSLPVQANPGEEALAKLDRAVGMFNSGMQKEAYLEASGALRTYFKEMLGINELTSDEILRVIKGSKDEIYIEDTRQCFMLCDLVKFARYEPDPDDFKRMIEYAKRIIV